MGMFDMLGGTPRRGGSMSPIALAILGTLAYRTLKGKGPLADVLGTRQGATNAPGTAQKPGVEQGSGTSGVGGVLGGLGAGGLGAGLRDLLDRFRQAGQEEKAQSWVSTGANRPIAPSELEQVLGNDRIQWLMEQTGLPKEQLLAGLSKELPDAIDELTPAGEVPTDEDLARRLSH